MAGEGGMMRRLHWPFVLMCSSFNFSFSLLLMIDFRTDSAVIYVTDRRCDYGEIELLDGVTVQLDVQEAYFRSEHLLNVLSDLAEERSLQTALADTSGDLVLVVLQLHRDDGCADGRRGVDDLLDSRNTLRDIHGRHAGEVERLQRHLRCRLAKRLSADGSDSLSGLDDGATILLVDSVEELLQLRAGNCRLLQFGRSQCPYRQLTKTLLHDSGSTVQLEASAVVRVARVVVSVVQSDEHALLRRSRGYRLDEVHQLVDELVAVDGVATHVGEAILVQEVLRYLQNLARSQIYVQERIPLPQGSFCAWLEKWSWMTDHVRS